jgi:hypothetical protein
MARPLRLLAAALACAAALAAAACGGDSGGQDLTEGLTPAEVLERSAEEAAGLESFRISLDAEGRLEPAPGADVPGGALLRGPLDLSGEGPVAPPDRASIDVRVSVSGLPLQVNVTRVGDAVYLGALGQDFQLTVSPEQVALLDLSVLYPSLVEWMAAPERAGKEDIDGVPTVRIRGAIDPERAEAELAPLLGEGLRPAGTVEAWVGTEDLLPRRVRVDARGEGRGVREAAVDLTATLSDFDADVEIEAPAGARRLDPDQLGALVGG